MRRGITTAVEGDRYVVGVVQAAGFCECFALSVVSLTLGLLGDFHVVRVGSFTPFELRILQWGCADGVAHVHRLREVPRLTVAAG
jgi:hypothetical protein